MLLACTLEIIDTERNCSMAKNGFNKRSKSSEDLPLKDLSLAKRLAIKHPASSLSLAKDIYLGGGIQKSDNIDSYETNFAEILLDRIAENHPFLVLPVLIDIIEFSSSVCNLDYASGLIYQLGKEYPLKTAEILKNTLSNEVGISSQLTEHIIPLLEGIEKNIAKYNIS